MKRHHIPGIIAFLFIVVFLYAGASKVMDFTIFKLEIGESPLLRPFAGWIAWMIPLMEAVTVVLLLIPAWRLKGLYASLGLMLAFTGYIIAIFSFDKDLPCSCGGIIEQLSWKGHLLFNSALVLLAFWSIRLQRSAGKKRSSIPGYTKYMAMVILLITASGCVRQRPFKTGKEGLPLPAFSLLLADSSTRLNTMDIAPGKPIVAFCFSPTCPFCRAEMGDILKHMDAFGNTRFYIFTMFPFKSMKSFYKEYHLQQYPNITVGVDDSNFFARYYNLRSLPFLAVYDGQKRLEQAFKGRTRIEYLKAVLQNN